MKQMFPEKRLELTHSNQKDRKTFLLRPYQQGDEPGIISCIYSEYGDTYFKRSFYDEEKLREKCQGEEYEFFVAEVDKEIVGMLIFHYFKEKECYLEPASEILKREIRGYGLAEAFVEYTFPLAKALNPNCLLVHAVTFHKITQKICEAQGMVPVGFRLGTFLMRKNLNSYSCGRCRKHSEGVMVLPVAKKEVGQVYLPDEIAAFADKIYKRLGVTYQIITGPAPEKKENWEQERVQLAISEDPCQRMGLIQILRHGGNLKEELIKITQKQKEPYWTFQITLNADGMTVMEEYLQAKEAGFFFTGLKPLCGETEQFYMQWCGTLDLNMEEYTLTEAFQEIRDDIQNFYDRRIWS